jgi:HNH endonuclease
MQPIGHESDLFGKSSSGGDDQSSTEVWKIHPDHPGYEFSNLGRAYSHYSRRFLKGRTAREGHIYLEMVRNGPTEKRPQIPLHRLILQVFVGPCLPGKEIVRHLDGDPRNNRVENLRWGTSQENSFDRHKHNGTSKGGRRSRAIKHTATGSEVQNPLRNSLEVAIKGAGDGKTVSIPMSLAKDILSALSSA